MRKRQKTTAPVALQLCLFSETEMEAMTERVTIKPINLFIADPARLYWQLEVGQALQGKEGREHRRTFTQRKVRTRAVVAKPPEFFTSFKT